MTDKINEDFKKNLINKIPSGELGSGEDVSNCGISCIRYVGIH